MTGRAVGDYDLQQAAFEDNKVSETRTSTSCILARAHDSVVRRVERRVAAATDAHIAQVGGRQNWNKISAEL